MEKVPYNAGVGGCSNSSLQHRPRQASKMTKSEYKREWYLKNKARVQDYNRQYRAANSGKRTKLNLSDPKHWRCDCGAACLPWDASWRWNGSYWEHHHGGQAGHFQALCLPYRMFRVHDGEDTNILVCAPSRSKAKMIGFCQTLGWFSGCEWTDVRCSEERSLRGYAQRLGRDLCLDGSTPEHQRLMRSLGWFQHDYSDGPCDCCGLYEWDELPMSKITKARSRDIWLCQECHGNIFQPPINHTHQEK